MIDLQATLVKRIELAKQSLFYVPTIPLRYSSTSADLPALPTQMPPVYDDSYNPVPPTLLGGAVAMWFGIVGPARWWRQAKWVFRNVLVGGTVVEATSWYVAFQSNIAQAGEYTHLIQNFLLGYAHNKPLFTADYTFLQRLLNDFPSVRDQYDLARRFFEQPLSQTIADRDYLLAQSSEVAAQETALLAARIIDIRLEIQRRELLAQQQADRFRLLAAQKLAAAANAVLLGPLRPELPRLPAASADP